MYLKPCQASMMGPLFVDSFRKKSFIADVSQGFRYTCGYLFGVFAFRVYRNSCTNLKCDSYVMTKQKR